MSKYTTEVRFICERYAGLSESADYASVDDVISAAVPKVFDFDFPIFDESYRNVLCAKILKHYYTREIGLETVGLWKLKLDTKMNEIMPYFNERYKTTVYKFNPLYDADYTKTIEGTDTGVNTNISKEESNSKGINENVKTLNTETTEAHDNITEDKHTGTDTNKMEYNSTEKTDEDISKLGSQTGSDEVAKTGGETDRVTGNDTNKKTGTEKDSGTMTRNNTHTDAYSDTPQGAIENVLQGSYLTNFRQVLDGENGTNDNTKTFDTKEEIMRDATDNKTYDTKETETRNLQDSQTEDNEITKKKTGDDTNTNTKNLTDSKKENININKKDTGTIGDSGSSSQLTEKTGSGSGSFENTKDYVEHVVGKFPGYSYAKAIMEFRDSLINIDMEIIDELKGLFMLLW